MWLNRSVTIIIATLKLLDIYKLLYRIVRLSCQSCITRKVCIMLFLRNCKM